MQEALGADLSWRLTCVDPPLAASCCTETPGICLMLAVAAGEPQHSSLASVIAKSGRQPQDILAPSCISKDLFAQSCLLPAPTARRHPFPRTVGTTQAGLIIRSQRCLNHVFWKILCRSYIGNVFTSSLLPPVRLDVNCALFSM